MAVVDFDVHSREPYAEGREFGGVGAYEKITGELTFAVNPANPANAGIVDLDKPIREARGRVRFQADVVLIVPADGSRGNGCLIVDVPNRGRPLVSSTLNMGGGAAVLDPLAPGDGVVYERGFSVAVVGWQHDVPRAMRTGLRLHPPRVQAVRGYAMAQLRPDSREETWGLSQLGSAPIAIAPGGADGARVFRREHENAPREELPPSHWELGTGREGTQIRFPLGPEPGHIYEVVYPAVGPPVAGAGMLAVRDGAAFFREGGFEARGFEHVIAIGVSQTGRLLRHMASLGLNVDEAGRQVFDGLFVHIAGGLRGQFNQRFGQPSARTPGLGHLFPFASGRSRAPYSGAEAGLLDTLRERGAVPKVVATNSSWEYWRGDASLLHVAPDGSTDLEPGPAERIYHLAGTHHIPGMLPLHHQTPDGQFRARHDFNVVDGRPLTRAAFMNLARWVMDGMEPPASRHPRLDDGTAMTREVVLGAFRALPGIEPLDPARLESVRVLDPGPEAAEGVVRYPIIEGEPYACRVPAVDDDLNDVSGIRLPDLTVPVGTHTGWNGRDPETGGKGSAATFVGFTSFFAADEDARRVAGDPRPSLESRYGGRERYLEAVRAAAGQLVRRRYVLDEDVDRVVNNCKKRYEAAMAGGRRG